MVFELEWNLRIGKHLSGFFILKINYMYSNLISEVNSWKKKSMLVGNLNNYYYDCRYLRSAMKIMSENFVVQTNNSVVNFAAIPPACFGNNE